jgi:DNA-binding response OmpR family regulator
MPIMDGFEMLRHLRQLSQFKTTPVIASSASVFEADQFKSVDAGANEFLPKPIEAETLLQLIQRYLELEWLYDTKVAPSAAQPSETLNSETLTPPPTETLQHFNHLVEMGDLDEITEQAKHLQQTDVHLIPFAQKILEMAENCELNALATFIHQFIPTS